MTTFSSRWSLISSRSWRFSLQQLRRLIFISAVKIFGTNLEQSFLIPHKWSNRFNVPLLTFKRVVSCLLLDVRKCDLFHKVDFIIDFCWSSFLFFVYHRSSFWLQIIEPLLYGDPTSVFSFVYNTSNLPSIPFVFQFSVFLEKKNAISDIERFSASCLR